MPLNREIDLMPGGDFAFLVVKPPTLAKQCELWFYDWDQVEGDRDDGRIYTPAFHGVIAEREMRILAKYLLKLSGDKVYKQVSVPNQEWNLAGERDRENE